MADVVVVGSLTVDLTAYVNRRPDLGETVIGTEFAMVPGGKGNNQALTCARQGVQTAMIGRVGSDAYADIVIAAGIDANVDMSHILRDPYHGTGIAHITVDEQGANYIAMIPRANSALSAQDIRAARDVFSGSRVVLTQLEIPVESARTALALGRSNGAITIVNPAPAQPIDDEFLSLADICIPNETEAAALTGEDVFDVESAVRAAEILRRRGCRRVIVTLGAAGAVLVAEAGVTRLPAFEVPVVDSVAAGDAFCGALAASLAKGDILDTALRKASAAGALAVTQPGASSSLPSGEAIDQFLQASVTACG